MSFPWDVMDVATRGYRKSVADALGISLSLVDQHCRAPKSFDGDAASSPLQRFIETTKALRAAGAPNSEMPVEYAAAELGYLPLIRADIASRDFSLVDIADATYSFADFLTCASNGMTDGVLTLAELQVLANTLQSHVRVMSGQLCALQSAIDENELAEVKERRGPHRALPRYLKLRAATA
jgi:hypothetical protein